MLSLNFKWKWKSLSHVWLFATPWTIQPMEFSRTEHWSGQPFPSPGDLPNPGIEPRSPTLQADSLPAEPQGKPRNTGVGSLSLLQWIFPTQELNWGLLHCRWILYQLSYQGSPQYTLLRQYSINIIETNTVWFQLHEIPWRRKWQPTLYSCLENSIDRGAWWATVYGVVKSQTRLSCTHTYIQDT